MIQRILIVIATFCLMNSGQVHAHAMLERSSPANNAVLSAAPRTIDLSFGHPTKLVMLKLLKGQEVIPLLTDNGQSAKTFSVALPALTSGKYLATWSTLSGDGHAMKGSITFTITGK
ncbi:copper resistance CopC family protein [Undibacterium sp. Xuan67W]|uniref:copper resistance CopC family protein n=1 Tax=Undibacterium sp. Xuan67W TaxID=3413057 RepID=UPI003BF25461